MVKRGPRRPAASRATCNNGYGDRRRSACIGAGRDSSGLVNLRRTISPTQGRLAEDKALSRHVPFMKVRRILPAAKASKMPLPLQSDRLLSTEWDGMSATIRRASTRQPVMTDQRALAAFCTALCCLLPIACGTAQLHDKADTKKYQHKSSDCRWDVNHGIH